MRSVLEAEGLQRRVVGISDRVKQALVSPIKEMSILAERVEGAVSLGLGTPSFQTPLHIRETVIRALAEDQALGKYPPTRGLPELRQSIARRLRERERVELDPDKEILVTAGSQEALYLALMTIVDPGDEVIIPTPCFPSHIDQVTLAAGRPVYVAMTEGREWSLSLDEIRNAISPKTKAIVLNSPANPTGAVLPERLLRAIGELAVEHKFFVITDQTYEFLVYDDVDRSNLLSDSSLRDRVIGCYTFSKEYAMTGWRVGYLCAESGIVEEAMKVHDASLVTAPRISQIAALAAIEGSQDCVREFKRQFADRRDLICRRLDGLTELFEYASPAGAYYVFPKIRNPKIDSFDLALRLLKEARVVTIPGEAFGPAGKGHLRLCFSVPAEDISEAFDRIEHFVHVQF